jgi:hypothetical protein
MSSEFPGENGFHPQPEWSMERHKMVGHVADRLLSQSVRDAVRDILAPGGQGSTLGFVAEWADELKTNPPSDPETKAFLNDPVNRESHGRWHYLNLPFGATTYDPDALSAFIPKDGAHAVGKVVECALAVITPTSRLSRTNGLRWLTHLVGDMHQPMHLGCGFVDMTKEPPLLVGDPQGAHSLASDRGGNNLVLPASFGGGNLHSYWDGVLATVTADTVEQAAQAVEPPVVTRETVKEVVASWVEDTLRVCKDAYWSVRIDQRVEGEAARFVIGLEQGLEKYQQRNEPHVTRQMARAAVRLAALVTALVS